MEFNPILLFIIIFILAPFIERLLKAGKQPPPEQRPRPQQRMPPQQRPRPELRRPERTASDEDSEPSAADMVPDDLWAILTGEQRPRPPAPPPRQQLPEPTAEEPRRQPFPARPGPVTAPAKRPRPAGQPPRPQTRPTMQQPRRPAGMPRTASGYDMRGDLPLEEDATLRRTPPPEVLPVEGYVREIPTYAPPEIVSLEELVIDDVKRHESFHDRLAALPDPARVRRARRHQLAQRFRASEELRRAIVMSDVLGPPKGLE